MKAVEWRSLDLVEPGTILAEAVQDDSGRILVPAGAELSESLLAALARRDIGQIRIELEVEEDPAARAAREAQVAAQLDHLFRLAGEGEACRELYRAVRAFRMAHDA